MTWMLLLASLHIYLHIQTFIGFSLYLFIYAGTTISVNLELLLHSQSVDIEMLLLHETL